MEPGIIAAVVITFVVVSLIWLFAFNASTGEKKIGQLLKHEFSVEDPLFLRVIGSLLGPELLPGNKLTAYQNGDQIFPAMLEAIRGARQSITFEIYIYWSGEIGKTFADALSERAKNGVKVHVLLDWAGSKKIDAKFLSEMEKAGVEVERFHPIRWYTLARLNNRTHRKLLVIDGKTGFTGGVGVADKWTGNAQDEEHWRDSHYRLEGPAVAQMQAAFIDNWIKVRGCVLHDERYFPPLPPVGKTLAHVFKSSKDEGSESVRLMYLASIAAARKSIRLAAAYFVPDDLAIRTLVHARRRGVSIEIITPGPHTDSALVQRASKGRWRKLLDAGIQIYEFQPTMFHCKVLIVDDVWVSVGSTNFDSRSFRLNAEANLNLFDREFALEQVKVFEGDKKRSRLVTLEEYNKRPLREKALENLAELLRSQL